MSEWDPFKADSGLKDDYDGEITAAEFIQGQRGGYSLELSITDEADSEETTLRLGVGSGWVSLDGGESVENEGSAKARFNERTGYMRFLNAAMKAGGDKELRSRSAAAYSGRGPMHAGLWVGLRFHFDVVNVPGDRPDEEGVWKPVEGGIPTVLPTEFLGVRESAAVSVTKPAKSAGTSTAKKATAASTTVTPSTAPELPIPAEDVETLRDLAQDLGYGEWVDKVMETKGSDGVLMARNRALMVAIGNEALYEEMRSPV